VGDSEVQDEGATAVMWLTREQFLDSLAIGGVLPALLIIFGAMVGYLGGGGGGDGGGAGVTSRERSERLVFTGGASIFLCACFRTDHRDQRGAVLPGG
jgi:hypothetical protein